MMKECVKNNLKTQMPDLDDETLGAIWEEYVSSAHRLWDELREKNAAGDGVGADRAAHTLKGCAATVGDNEVFEVVQAWRTAVKEGDTVKAESLWERIDPLIAEIG